MIFRLMTVAASLLVLAACSSPPYTNVDNAGLQRLLDEGAALVDVRRAEEWRQTGVVAGSDRLTFVDASGRLEPGFLDTLTERYDPNEPLVLICRTGNRTDMLAWHLAENMGYTRVYNVRDGITEWIRRGLPVTAG
ncbi:MAG: rhodanese-like domain-containing protein [Gammaproteobacteria bacterium]|nr:rhodanese-like domain-containing protein [Gammaproteobacteria bacterium]